MFPETWLDLSTWYKIYIDINKWENCVLYGSINVNIFNVRLDNQAGNSFVATICFAGTSQL